MRLQRLAPTAWLAALGDSRSDLAGPDRVVLGRFALESWTIAPRVLDEHLLYWLAQGAIEGQFGSPISGATAGTDTPAAAVTSTPRRFGAGSLVWVAPGVPHRFTLAAGSKRIVIYNLRFRLSRGGRLLRLQPDLLTTTGSGDWEMLFAAAADEAQAPGRYGIACLRGLITQLAVRVFRATEAASAATRRNKRTDQSVGDLAREPAREPARELDRFQRERLARLAESAAAERLTPADLARHLALSPDYFARVFRQSYGVSPKRWLVQQRIRLAAVQLTQSPRNVSEVARALGYPDLFLFSRQFKSVMGLSPRAYRLRAGR